jgi:hypothetical protein
LPVAVPGARLKMLPTQSHSEQRHSVRSFMSIVTVPSSLWQFGQFTSNPLAVFFIVAFMARLLFPCSSTRHVEYRHYVA